MKSDLGLNECRTFLNGCGGAAGGRVGVGDAKRNCVVSHDDILLCGRSWVIKDVIGQLKAVKCVFGVY